MLSGGGGAVRRELLPHSNGSHNDHTKNITIAVCSIGHAGSLLPLSIFLTLLHFLSGRCLGVARVRGRGSRGVALEATFLHWGIKRGLSVCLPAQSISSIRSDTNILWLAICLAETVSRGLDIYLQHITYLRTCVAFATVGVEAWAIRADPSTKRSPDSSLPRRIAVGKTKTPGILIALRRHGQRNVGS